MTYLAPALLVACPECGAAPHVPCEPKDPTSEFGRRMIEVGMPHMARVEALAARNAISPPHFLPDRKEER